MMGGRRSGFLLCFVFGANCWTCREQNGSRIQILLIFVMWNLGVERYLKKKAHWKIHQKSPQSLLQWFGIRIGVPLSSNFFHKGIPGIQTTGPQTTNLPVADVLCTTKKSCLKLYCSSVCSFSGHSVKKTTSRPSDLKIASAFSNGTWSHVFHNSTDPWIFPPRQFGYTMGVFFPPYSKRYGAPLHGYLDGYFCVAFFSARFEFNQKLYYKHRTEQW